MVILVTLGLNDGGREWRALGEGYIVFCMSFEIDCFLRPVNTNI
jgi:hypothetical protein